MSASRLEQGHRNVEQRLASAVLVRSDVRARDTGPIGKSSLGEATIPGDVDEHTDSPVEFVAWLADELDPVLAQSPVGGIELFDPKERPDSPGVLPTNGGQLIIRVGLDEQ